MCLCWCLLGVTRPIAVADMSRSRREKYRHKIKFTLDGQVIEVDGADPSRTVLEYLREDLLRTGTKEGCAEGDCGACTVVIADIDSCGERLSARAINSCIQFLPTLDGKELITVESLEQDDLHPAQTAMIDSHASQCGFCTPGFVMSLFALYKTNLHPTRQEIDDALAGNLCRCTGYRPIVDAANKMYEDLVEDQNWTRLPAGSGKGEDEAYRLDRLRSLKSTEILYTESQGRRFYAPVTLRDLSALIEENPDAVILAGGTDIGIWVTKQYRDLKTIIFIGNVAELMSAIVTPDYIDIGAAVSFTDAMPLIIDHYPGLEELFLRFASPPIRNAATLGGNIANGSPIGDSMPALLALDSLLVLRKGTKSRRVSLNDFYIGYQQTILKPGEFIERILIPLPREHVNVASYKVSKRFDQDISSICVAYWLQLEGSTVTGIRVACGGMAEIPKRAIACEQAIIGKEWTEETIALAMNALDEDYTPITDLRASAAYRRLVCRNLLQRFYLDCNDKLPTGVYAHGR